MTQDDLIHIKRTIGCLRCGTNKGKARLRFHHIYKQEKRHKLDRLNTLTDDQVWDELGRCTILCFKCNQWVVLNDAFDHPFPVVSRDKLVLKQAKAAVPPSQLVQGRFGSSTCPGLRAPDLGWGEVEAAMRPEAEILFTSLELSRQLDEAGVPKPNHWWWSKPPGGRWRVFGGFGEPSCEHLPAFLAEEMLRILPQVIHVQDDDSGGFCSLWIDRPADAFDIGYEHCPYLTQYDQSLTNACAKLYLALKERGLL